MCVWFACRLWHFPGTPAVLGKVAAIFRDPKVPKEIQELLRLLSLVNRIQSPGTWMSFNPNASSLLEVLKRCPAEVGIGPDPPFGDHADRCSLFWRNGSCPPKSKTKRCKCLSFFSWLLRPKKYHEMTSVILSQYKIWLVVIDNLTRLLLMDKFLTTRLDFHCCSHPN